MAAIMAAKAPERLGCIDPRVFKLGFVLFLIYFLC
jgi:hypothetical protein